MIMWSLPEDHRGAITKGPTTQESVELPSHSHALRLIIGKIWTGPRTTLTVSVTGPSSVLGSILLSVAQAQLEWS